MRHRASTRAQSARVALTLALCALSASCASWRPPMPSASRSESAEPVARLTQTSSVKIEPVEGRPNGMLLRIRATRLDERLTALDVLRSSADQDVPVQRIPLDARMRARLTAPKGALLLDASIQGSGQWSYRVQTVAQGEALAQSEAAPVEWEPPLAAPRVRAEAGAAPPHVMLRWGGEQAPGGALVFRRALTPSSSKLARHRTLRASHRGQWLDRDVSSGAVYVYRIAGARFDARGIGYYGFPSEDLYITVPPDATRPTQPASHP